MTLGKSFIDTFSKANKPVEQEQSMVPAALSTKTGINSKKKTQLQQGMLQAIATPQMGGANGPIQ